MLEAALITPLILLLTIFAIDFTRLLTNYALLSRAVYEGVRYASGAPLLGAGQVKKTTATANSNLAHQNVISRVQGLLGSGYLNLLGNTTEISSQLCTRNNGTEDVGRVVSVRIEFNYSPIAIGSFPLLFGYSRTNIPIVVQDYGPYLLTPSAILAPCV